MDYNNPSDSSGTDDDIPPHLPNHTSRVTRGGRPSGNGRAAAGSSFGRPQIATTPDQQIRKLELEAYTAVLRAFGAQSDAISWAKERLMSDLRKELSVADEQHRDLLSRVSVDETLRQIREWRELERAPQPPSAPIPIHDPAPSPAVSQSRKKQKTVHVTQTPPILALPPQPLLKPPSIVPPAPSPAPSKRGVPVGPRGKKSKGGRQPPVVAATTPKTPGGPPAGRGSNLGRGPAPGRGAGVGSDSPADHHLGRRVKTRWPEDNTFYEAVITDYNAEKGLHALVYDMGTTQETWEWVNLKEISSSDMKWVDAPPISVANKGNAGTPPSVGRGSGRGLKRGSGGRGGSASAAGRARGAARGGQAAISASAVVPISQTRSWRGPSANENGLERKGSRTLQIQVPVVEPLLKEGENVKDINDLEKLEAMKRKTKAHADAIRAALSELGESSEEAGSDDGAHGPHTRLVDRERVNRSLQASRDPRDDTDDEEDTAGDGRGEESDGEQMVGEGGGASDGEQLLAEEGDEEDEDG